MSTQKKFKSILQEKGIANHIVHKSMAIYNKAREGSKQLLNNANSAQQSNHIIMALFFIVIIAIIVTVTLTVSGFCNPSDLNHAPIILILILIMIFVCYKW